MTNKLAARKAKFGDLSWAKYKRIIKKIIFLTGL